MNSKSKRDGRLKARSGRSTKPGRNDDRRACSRERFRLCRECIEREYLYLAGLREIALRCHLTESHVCRLFRRFEQRSPFRLLRELQMTWAADQLRITDCRVRDVAEQLNLDPFHFSRLFRRFHGRPPSRLKP